MFEFITNDILNDRVKDTSLKWFILIKKLFPALSLHKA